MGVEYCEHAKPIWFDSGTQVIATPAPIQRQILEHNKTVKALCKVK